MVELVAVGAPVAREVMGSLDEEYFVFDCSSTFNKGVPVREDSADEARLRFLAEAL